MSAIKEHISVAGKKEVQDEKEKQNNDLIISMRHLKAGLQKISKKSITSTKTASSSSVQRRF